MTIKKTWKIAIVSICLLSSFFIAFHLAAAQARDGYWKKVKELALGDFLYDAESGWSKITSIEFINKEVPVYNLNVGYPHTYLANDVLVHNKDGGGGGGGEPTCSVNAVSPKHGTICWVPGSTVLTSFHSVCTTPVTLGYSIYNADTGALVHYGEGTSYQETGSHSYLPRWWNGSNWEYISLPDGNYTWTVEVVGTSIESSAPFSVDCGSLCTVPSVIAVTDHICLPGKTSTTWNIVFSYHDLECDDFSLEVDTSRDGLPDDVVAGLSGTTYSYTYTTPGDDNANTSGASSHSINFRTVREGNYSEWFGDEFGTDVSAPGCDFEIHEQRTNPLAPYCSGVDVTGGATNVGLVDLEYTGTNTGCSAVAERRYSLISGSGTWGNYTDQCFAGDLSISSQTGTFNIYSVFRDSLDQESAECSEQLTHPVSPPTELRLNFIEDLDQNGVRSGTEVNLPVSRVTSVSYKLLSAEVWTNVTTITNPLSISLPVGTYQFRIGYANQDSYCNTGNYATGTRTEIGEYQYVPGLNLFQLQIEKTGSAQDFDLGAWEPWSAKRTYTQVWVDDDCAEPFNVGDVSTGYYYPSNLRLTGTGLVHGSTATLTTNTGRFTLGNGTTSFRTTYCDQVLANSEIVNIVNTPLRPYYRFISPYTTPLRQEIDMTMSSPVSTNPLVLCYEPPSWFQVENVDTFASQTLVTVPAGSYFNLSGIVFSETEMQCLPGYAADDFDPFVSYGSYNPNSAIPNWPFAWDFDNPLPADCTPPENYSSLESGVWYCDTSEKFRAAIEGSTYEVSRNGSAGQGTAYVILDSSLILDDTFSKSAVGETQGLVVFVSGDLTISESLIGETLPAVFVVRGNVILAGPEDIDFTVTSYSLVVRGGLFVKNGEILANRKYIKTQRQLYPIMRVYGDPVYMLFEGDSNLSTAPIFWEEL